MVSNNRRGITIFFLVFGISLIALAIALQVGWIFFSLERVAILVIGIVFFAAIITGLVLNMIFLLREINRNEQHDAFINSVTHELKTPIASLKLYLETLQTREVSETQRKKFYETMLADTERLNRTVEQVLYAGRTGDRQRQLNFTEVELNKLLLEAVELIKKRYNLDDDNFSLLQTEEIKLRADVQELQVAFTNLLDNAVKYSTDKVEVKLEVKSLNNKTAEIRISDAGIGLSADELKRVFKRFYRVSQTATGKIKGTGLGLYIVRAIIKKQNGKVFAESKGAGLGTTFVVQLPKL